MEFQDNCSKCKFVFVSFMVIRHLSKYQIVPIISSIFAIISWKLLWNNFAFKLRVVHSPVYHLHLIRAYRCICIVFSIFNLQSSALFHLISIIQSINMQLLWSISFRRLQRSEAFKSLDRSYATLLKCIHLLFCIRVRSLILLYVMLNTD